MSLGALSSSLGKGGDSGSSLRVGDNNIRMVIFRTDFVFSN